MLCGVGVGMVVFQPGTESPLRGKPPWSSKVLWGYPSSNNIGLKFLTIRQHTTGSTAAIPHGRSVGSRLNPIVIEPL